MSKKKVSFTQLAHDVVRQSPEPLTAVDIQAQVHTIHSITTKNPKNTIRNAITQSKLIVSTGDGRYGWKLRLINGATIRHTLSETELTKKVLHWDSDVKDLLWPTFFATQKYEDRSPAKVALPNETVSEMPLKHYGHELWGSPASAEFWVWLTMQQPQAGDYLLFRAVDGEARWYAVTFEARGERNLGVILQRNQALVKLGQQLMQRPYAAMDYDITTHALATGFYHHDVPPDPFGELWDEILQGGPDGILQETRPEDRPDVLLSELFEKPAQVYDPSAPPSLPREYNPEYGRRRARSSKKARQGSVSSWTFRINHRTYPNVWADIELAEDQTLEDLHLQIQSAFRWDDDHLYSFFIADEEANKVDEVGSPWSETVLHTHLVQIGQLGLAPGRLLLYLFDYGDNHEFDVEVIDLNPIAPKGKYPKILTYPKSPPKQYPDGDEAW